MAWDTFDKSVLFQKVNFSNLNKIFGKRCEKNSLFQVILLAWRKYEIGWKRNV